MSAGAGRFGTSGVDSYWRAVPAALVLAALIVSCGVKGPPQPPLKPAPAAPEGLEVRVREGCVELTWRAAGSEDPEALPAVSWEILRARPSGEGEEPAFWVIDRPQGPPFLDCSLPLGARAVYMVRGISEQGRKGPVSPQVQAANYEPPLAPLHPRTEPGDGFVELTWAKPADLPGEARFNVYRAEDPALFPWRPINPEPMAELRYVDGGLDNGKRYYYEVRAVVEVEGKARVEGSGSATVSAVPCDRIAPLAPQGLTAGWTGAGVALQWFRNQEPDLAGYLVFRRPRGQGEFTELFLDPIPETNYLDRSPRRGMEYEYLVCAVDTAVPPNRSAGSELQVVYAEP